MASLTQWTWVWVNSGSWWWTGRPGVLQSMESQRVGHYWATELTEVLKKHKNSFTLRWSSPFKIYVLPLSFFLILIIEKLRCSEKEKPIQRPLCESVADSKHRIWLDLELTCASSQTPGWLSQLRMKATAGHLLANCTVAQQEAGKGSWWAEHRWEVRRLADTEGQYISTE